MMEFLYLKCEMKLILSLCWDSTISLGDTFFLPSSFASTNEGGKYIASDLDFVFEFLTCMIRLKHAKCFWSLLAALSSSFCVLKEKGYN